MHFFSLLFWFLTQQALGVLPASAHVFTNSNPKDAVFEILSDVTVLMFYVSIVVALFAFCILWLQKPSKVFDGKIKGIELTAYDHQYEEQFLYEKNWKPQPGDILCLTYPKTGQTMLLHVMNQIRSKAKDEQSLQSAVFWPTRAWAFQQDLDGPQKYSPRLFKSHNPLSVYSEKFGAKFITIVRDPVQVLYSLHHFLLALEVTNLQVDDFADVFFFAPTTNILSNIFQFYVDFWMVHDREDILILCFEDFIRDKRKHIEILRKFMGLDALGKDYEYLIRSAWKY